MKSKSITKKATSRKRPKSVLRKAWATRRANAEAAERFGLRRENAELTEMLKEAVTDKAISPVGATSSKVEKARAEQRAESEARTASLSPDTTTSETATHRSEMTAREWVEIADHISFLKERGFTVASA